MLLELLKNWGKEAMNISEIKEQYEKYYKRMQENDVEFAIITFGEFKKAMKLEGKKDV